MVSTSRCEVLKPGHTRVHCVSPPGAGLNYLWSVTVAGQAATVLSPSAVTTSYAPPTVISAVVSGPGVLPSQPGSVPTGGGATVTLTGSNFGAEPGAVTVTWDGRVVPGVVLVTSHSVLAFPSPAGEGPPVSVSVTVAGQTVATLMDSPSVPLRFAFGRPVITSLSLYRGQNEATMDCSRTSPDGRPLGSGGATSARLVLEGANFGVNGSSARVMIHGTECAVVTAASTSSRLLCDTGVCSGEKQSSIVQ